MIMSASAICCRRSSYGICGCAPAASASSAAFSESTVGDSHADGAAALPEADRGPPVRSSRPRRSEALFYFCRVAEDLSREFHGGRRNRSRRLADGGLVANALGDSKRLLEHGIENRPLAPTFCACCHASFTWGTIWGAPTTIESKCSMRPAENMQKGGFIEQAVEVLPLAQLQSIFGAEQPHDGVRRQSNILRP